MATTTVFLRPSLCYLVILVALPPLAADIFSGSTTASGSVDFQYVWDNCSFSSSVCFSGGTQESVKVPFSFQIGLPSAPQSGLTSAMLAQSLSSDSGPASITSETSTPIATQLVNQYSTCNFSLFGLCVASTYHATYSNENYAPNLTFNGSAAAYVDSITSPGASWAGAPTNAGSVDLLSLGFGPNSLYGGDLTVSGFLQLTGPAVFPTVNNTSGSFSSKYAEAFYSSSSVFGFIPTGSADAIIQHTDNSLGTGFNADTNFDLQYSVTDSEGGTLTLVSTPVSTPEPSTVVLLSGVLAALALRRFRMRRAEASERR
jgi:hypothetical protein